MFETIAYFISIIALLLTLYFSSQEDLKYHRISKKYVMLCFIIVICYNTVVGGSVEKTISFVITLGIFCGLTFISKGMFGFGDALILGALGWFIGDLIYLEYFFIVLVFCMLIIGSYFVIINHKQNHKGWMKIFNNTMFVSINDLKPGMVLADDYFMKGLTEQEIDDMRKTETNPILVKQTYPFIPVIFVAFLCYVVVVLAVL
jgi:Flp pilus assembly protein protease CpaA